MFLFEQNGIITASVYVALSISLTSFGFVSDFVGQKKLINDTLSRKIFETIALGGPAICLALVPLVRCDIALVVSLLAISMTIFGMNAGGDKPVVVDIAPDHSGTIYGITNAIASLPGILAPLFVGFLLDGKVIKNSALIL
jgi:MFS family permease